MNKTSFLNTLLWGVYPYLTITLFLVVPIIRMVYRPFSWSTRASGMFSRDLLGAASLALHWGLLLLLLGHLAGFVGGLLGLESWLKFFYWAGLIGGFSALLGSITALARRLAAPEVRAMSQWDDYVVHVFLIAIMALALFQVVIHKIFGVAYTASSWLASVARFTPQPELMASASLISKWHVFLALTFFGLFPFTKLVHFWTLPVNYFVRPYQSMRTNLYKYQRKWEYALRSDKSFLTYSLIGVAVFFGGFSMLLGYTKSNESKPLSVAPSQWTTTGRLAGLPLYVSQCARCHGLSGDGQGLGADSPTFAAPPRDFTDGLFAFISTDNGIAADEDLAYTIRHGLVPAGMPAFDLLTEEQIQPLVAVVRGFARAQGEPPGKRLIVPPPPDKLDRELGRQLFVQACAPCHGEYGQGDGPQVATMKGFKGRPVRPRDLTRADAYKVGTAPEQIYLRIAAGTPPVMPAFHESFTPEQIWAIVQYVEEEFVSGKMARQLASMPRRPAPPPAQPASQPQPPVSYE